jgi:preprotein translocase subunit SecA
MVQAKGHHFAIVDEIDSILIDESRTPLIIAAPDTDSGDLYSTFARVVPQLQIETDYTIDEKQRKVAITEQGIEKIEKILKISNIYEEGGVRYVQHLEQALRAQVLFHRDKDYVVRNGEIVIVDEFTGRLMPGRRWSGGLHQSVEAKEGVQIQKESRTLATITFQNYFRLYSKLAGMTGTAQTSAEEFHKVYKLDVITIPTNRTPQRIDLPDRIYKTETGKFKAIAREVKERHAKGQPVLIGTVSIQKNEILSMLLQREGVPHKVLNAKNHEQEGEVVAQAGREGGVTVATNMAGRGVDIILGGNPPDLTEASSVKDLGGLFVIGTERHEARRIDNQLRGRAGRQGDPGMSQFFISAEDDVARIFGGDSLKNIMERLGVTDEDVIENRFVSSAIEQAQTKIEGFNFDARKHVLEYDNVLSKHREAIYALRKSALFETSSEIRIKEYIHQTLTQIIRMGLNVEIGEPDIEHILHMIETVLPLDDTLSQQIRDTIASKNIDEIVESVIAHADTLYIVKESDISAETMRHLEKVLMLRVIDELWIDHLDQMQYLQETVGLRAYGQRDPLVEYKVEGQKLFTQLMQNIALQVASSIFKVAIAEKPKIMNQGNEVSGSSTTTKSLRASSPAHSHSHASPAESNIGRNDPCPCGSGKKYKKCGLLNTEEHQKLMGRK